MEELKRKSLGAVLKATPDNQGEGIVEAYVSVFGVKDSYGDVMQFGCFAKSIAAKPPVGVWMHKWDTPIGRTLEIKEVPAGDPSLPADLRAYGALYVKAKLSLGTEKGREAYELLKDEVIDEFSIGYFEVETNESTVGEERVTNVTEVRLIEWSPVLRGANPLTQPISVKDNPRPLSFADHSEQVLGHLQGFTKRASGLTQLRATQGETPSKARIAEFRAVHDELGKVLTLLEAPSEEEVIKAQADALAAIL